MNIPAPDLTARPPRSPRTRLGGYALLPRMLDKGRAELVGKNGEFHFNCPVDQSLLSFIGVDAEALKAELATGRATEKSSNGSKRMRSPSARHGKSRSGRPGAIKSCPPMSRRGIFSMAFKKPPVRNARTSRRGPICSIWTTTLLSAARPEPKAKRRRLHHAICAAKCASAKWRPRLPRVELDDELLVDDRRDLVA